MSLLDRHASVGRKLLIAEQQGWIEEGLIKSESLSTAEKIATARREVLAGLQQEGLKSEDVLALRDRLQEALSEPTALAAGPETSSGDDQPAASAVGSQITAQLDAITAETDITTASAELASVCESLAEIETQLIADFNATAQRLIDSGDESIAAALTMFDETPRFRRAERSLLNIGNPLFDELKQHHNVEVLALQNGEALELLDGMSTEKTPEELAKTPTAATTDLASGIVATQRTSNASDDGDEGPRLAPSAHEDETAAKPNTAVVLITDGLHNAGPSPLQTARVLGGQGIAFYPVAVGATQRAPDVAVTGLEHPQMVFQKDRVRGSMTFRDHMPAGRPLKAQIEYDGTVVWEKQLLTEDSGERRVDFEFGIEELVERLGSQFESDITQHAVTMNMTASIVPLAEETETTNNSRPLRFAAITQSYRMLIIDGRSRWETRYLRNAFERDSQWDVSVVIAGPGTDDESLPRGEGDDLFPETRSDLFAFDIIVFGELSPELLQDHEYTWIREFVERRGGGLIFIDGQRGRMKAFTEQNLAALLPVEWLDTDITSEPTMLQLTEKGAQLPALVFEPDRTANERFWNELPPPHTLNAVKALPGAEVLVEAIVNDVASPAVVTQSYGSGRILYMATDETWRWRYKNADTYHQRIWNQLATYVMPRPYSSSDEYLAIDTGPVSYEFGETAPLRVRLTNPDGKPAAGSTVDALLWKQGRVAATVSLSEDPDVPGTYLGTTAALDEGEYEVSVRASGFSTEALKSRGEFVVLPPESGELAETACNEPLLQQMAADSGGVFLREEQIGRLAELLSPLSSGRIVESDDSLFKRGGWLGPLWFCFILALLTLEWFLRKRAGLL